ncbi:hypothetical protein DFJ73DRAFT_769485 [Zopfochytrium polystomum]|nr:hypothetical protein DFJ73DRAFT_769485 [Zopfochytrium polystomum]
MVEDQQTGVDEASVFASPATQHCKASCLDDTIGCYSAAAAVRARPDNHLLYGNRSAVYFEARGNGDALCDCIDGIAASSSSADTDAFHAKITAQLVNIAGLQSHPSALVADVAVALLLSPLSDAQQRLLVAAADDGPPVGSRPSSTSSSTACCWKKVLSSTPSAAAVRRTAPRAADVLPPLQHSEVALGARRRRASELRLRLGADGANYGVVLGNM